MRRRTFGQNDECRMDLTPVIDMSFLLVVFFLCLPFRSLDAKLAAWLPEQGFRPVDEPVPEIDVKVRVRGDRAGATYEVAGERTTDIEAVLRRIREGREAAGGGLGVRGEVRADAKVPVKFVVAVLNKFVEAGVKDVRFHGAELPSEEVRRRR